MRFLSLCLLFGLVSFLAACGGSEETGNSRDVVRGSTSSPSNTSSSTPDDGETNSKTDTEPTFEATQIIDSLKIYGGPGAEFLIEAPFGYDQVCLSKGEKIAWSVLGEGVEVLDKNECAPTLRLAEDFNGQATLEGQLTAGEDRVQMIFPIELKSPVIFNFNENQFQTNDDWLAHAINDEGNKFFRGGEIRLRTHRGNKNDVYAGAIFFVDGDQSQNKRFEIDLDGDFFEDPDGEDSLMVGDFDISFDCSMDRPTRSQIDFFLECPLEFEITQSGTLLVEFKEETQEFTPPDSDFFYVKNVFRSGLGGSFKLFLSMKVRHPHTTEEDSQEILFGTLPMHLIVY